MPAHYIGLISGTSMDGIDAVLADLSTDTPRSLAVHSHPFPDALRQTLMDITQPDWQGPLSRLGQLDSALGRLFGEAALALIETAGVPASAIQAIGSHGQTVCHQPEGPDAFTLQLGDPNHIAQLTGITTVADFRRRDMAAGGQGAPLAPAFHAAFMRDAGEDRVALNIGGMANITTLPRQPDTPAMGFDTGPGNVLMDYWAGIHLQHGYDEGGQWARGGSPVEPLLAAMRADAYFALPPPKSTGREYFHGPWLEGHLARLGELASARDVQATLLELTASSIRDAIDAHAGASERVLVCGGGVHNRALMERLGALMPARRVASTSELGIEPDWVEALAFAWLARQTLERRPGNLPEVTGAGERVILGGIYWGQV